MAAPIFHASWQTGRSIVAELRIAEEMADMETSMVAELTMTIDDVVAPDFRPGKTIRVTRLRYETVSKMRPALIDVARAGHTITYGDLRAAIKSRYPERAFGPLLDLLSIDCEQRDEPSLAALVVRADTGEVGDEFVGDASEARAECYEHWSNQPR